MILQVSSSSHSSGQLASQFGKGRVRERTGNYFAGVVPAEQFTTRDNEFAVINATTAPAFTALCGAMGQPELVTTRGSRRGGS